MNTPNQHTDTLPEIWLISSWLKENNLEFAKRLGETYAKAAVIQASDLSEMIMDGDADYDPNKNEENERRYELIIRNMCLLARSFSEAGFLPILSVQVHSQFYLDAFCNYLRGGVLRFATIVDESKNSPADINNKGLVIQAAELNAKNIINSIVENSDDARIM